MSSNVSDQDFYRLQNAVMELEGTVELLSTTINGLIQEVGTLQLRLREMPYVEEDDEDTQPGIAPAVSFMSFPEGYIFDEERG